MMELPRRHSTPLGGGRVRTHEVTMSVILEPDHDSSPINLPITNSGLCCGLAGVPRGVCVCMYISVCACGGPGPGAGLVRKCT
jgi:hypothetical protein